MTCTTHSSTILAWKSSDYIGDGTQLEFLSVHQPGTSLESATNPNTSATLVSVSMENGKIVSTLSIVVLANLGGVHRVTCINVGIGTRETIYFQVGGEGRCMYSLQWPPPVHKPPVLSVEGSYLNSNFRPVLIWWGEIGHCGRGIPRVSTSLLWYST